jgi:hypothetical protein
MDCDLCTKFVLFFVSHFFFVFSNLDKTLICLFLLKIVFLKESRRWFISIFDFFKILNFYAFFMLKSVIFRKNHLKGTSISSNQRGGSRTPPPFPRYLSAQDTLKLTGGFFKPPPKNGDFFLGGYVFLD